MTKDTKKILSYQNKWWMICSYNFTTLVGAKKLMKILNRFLNCGKKKEMIMSVVDKNLSYILKIITLKK
jgi:hypothetical protein